eukprot:4848337-Prorocentrum_lima.AAC.1
MRAPYRISMRTRAAIGCNRPEGSGGSPASASSLADMRTMGFSAEALAFALGLGAGTATKSEGTALAAM